MALNDEVLKEIRARIEHDPMVDPHNGELALALHGDQVALQGEVHSITAKRRACAIAAELAGREHVEDHVKVRPSEDQEDGAITAWLIRAFEQEGAFRNCDLMVWHKQRMDTIRNVGAREGTIQFSVDGGVVTLGGQVWSLSHRRLAELLGWWAPGSRNVENQITIEPEERDSDQEQNDAVRIALEKDPLVHADRINVATRNGTVILNGIVGEQQEKEMAGNDVLYLGPEFILQNDLQVTGTGAGAAGGEGGPPWPRPPFTG